MTTACPPVSARRLRVTGVVQGVGFRPFVHRLAVRHSLTGWVRNVGGEVQIAVQGTSHDVDDFVAALTREAPPLAHIEQVDVELVAMESYDRFVIEQSSDPVGLRQPVSPDVAVCAACEAELFDAANRRYRYPFITCTDCGPRFTVIEAMPYDRERTSMRRFAQCPACLEEYRSPADRRYHSETNSCPACGPRLWFERTGVGRPVARSDDPLAVAAALLRGGGIVALKGLGGFHLAVDARSDLAVARLRERKNRHAKPFAVMVANVVVAERIARVSEDAAALLVSPVRPIVILPRRRNSGLSAGIAPGIESVGVMLPSTPLHHLLLALFDAPLVMTSGNLSEEPIATDNDEARERLGPIADGLLLHDRDIVSRYDDSVIRATRRTRVVLRRARGLAPLPLRLPVPSPVPLVAVGPDLKNTFTLVEGARAYVSQHIGDLDTIETVVHFREALTRFQHLFQIEPTVAVRDMHPGYLSTRLAEELGLANVVTVQHHHAHIAAVLAEHGETGPAIGVAYDGTGYGDDGNTWGAEILLADLTGYRRMAQLRYAPMPGGDLAAREPWRAALGYLSLESGPEAAAAFAGAFEGIPRRDRTLAEAQITRRLNAPLVSSMGRLFDAASAVISVHRGRQFEGQAAMQLESLAGRRKGRVIEMKTTTSPGGVQVLDPLPLLIELGERRRRGTEPAELAADFHASVIVATARLIEESCEHTAVRTVVLGGGVFQNARFGDDLPETLAAAGLRVLMPLQLSPNDGGISYGQAAVAAARLALAVDPPAETEE